MLEVIGVAGKSEGLQLQNIEGSGPRQSSLSVQLTVSALGADAKEGHIVVEEVWSVPRLNVVAPRVSSQQIQMWKHLQGLNLPRYSGGQVEPLLGANILEAVL